LKFTGAFQAVKMSTEEGRM